ncbi:hypothetical protein [Spiroplasma endosymbiont of Nebria brevicollis]|uniref:hypothetical protein n=1 Tax=Spiroplasma endosymbiont of Nebria brevicollis TaxID=3066284 RepID=UPI00313E4E3E
MTVPNRNEDTVIVNGTATDGRSPKELIPSSSSRILQTTDSIDGFCNSSQKSYKKSLSFNSETLDVSGSEKTNSLSKTPIKRSLSAQ